MSFKMTKADLKKSALCPPGMHAATLIEVEAAYVKPDNGNTVQKCDFETDAGYVISAWFNAKMMASLFEFVQAADKVTFNLETMEDMSIELKEYKGKRVTISVSHVKNKDGKINAQIDNFYEEGKIPF